MSSEDEIEHDEVEEDEDDDDDLEDDEEEVVVEKKRKVAKGAAKKKPKKDPNKPKRNMSAYFLFSNANRSRIKEENPGASFGELAKLVSAAYKNLDDDERADWEERAAEDKVRYNDQMKGYVAPYVSSDDEEEGGRGKKKKKAKKDPNAPKRNMSAYFLFSNAMRPKIKEEHPEASFGDLAKLVSARYKALSEKDKKKWAKKAEADKARYQQEMEVYRDS